MYFRIILVLLLFIIFTGCKEKETINDDNYFGGKVMILGHAGMGLNYYKPADTYQSIEPVIGIGADGSEMDIQLTKDSVLVIFHDDEMNPKTTCGGRIYEQNWIDIKQCKYYAVENNIYINSVDELMSKLPNLQSWYFSFDCKVDNNVSDKNLYQGQFLRAIQRLCEKYNITDHVLIEGGNDFLQQAKLIGLRNKLFLFDGLTNETINTAVSNQYFGITTSIDNLSDLVTVAHQQGLYIMTWSPNNFSQNKTTLLQKPDIIQTDDPISILKYLNRYNYEYIIP